MTVSLGPFLLGAIVLGCTSSRAMPPAYPPTQAAISAAHAAGAESHPHAAFHLRLARKELATAELLARRGSFDAAASMLDRACVDAELSTMEAREADAYAEAQHAQARLAELARKE